MSICMCNAQTYPAWTEIRGWHLVSSSLTLDLILSFIFEKGFSPNLGLLFWSLHPPVLGLQSPTMAPSFYLGAADASSGSHAWSISKHVVHQAIFAVPHHCLTLKMQLVGWLCSDKLVGHIERENPAFLSLKWYTQCSAFLYKVSQQMEKQQPDRLLILHKVTKLLWTAGSSPPT